MTTVQDVFDVAMDLMDEDSDTEEYEVRTISILNILIGELFPYSDTFAFEEPRKRPIVKQLFEFEDEIQLDDYICRSVLPYGLAAHLLEDENPTSANFFQQRYDELKAMLQRGLPAESEPIYDVYGGGYFPYNHMAEW